MSEIQKQFDGPVECICRAIESCRTWAQLDTAYRWGIDVVLTIGDHLILTGKNTQEAVLYKQSVLRKLQDCFVRQRRRIEDEPEVEYVNVREVPKHVSVCRTCAGAGHLPEHHECPVCKGSGRVYLTTTVRTIITPFAEER